MVALVLQAASQQSTAVNLEHRTVELGQGGLYKFGAGNIGPDIVHTQATFGKEVFLAVGLNNRVDEDEGHDVTDGA